MQVMRKCGDQMLPLSLAKVAVGIIERLWFRYSYVANRFEGIVTLYICILYRFHLKCFVADLKDYDLRYPDGMGLLYTGYPMVFMMTDDNIEFAIAIELSTI